MEQIEKWPVYKDKLVICGSLSARTGVATCWTDREVASRSLPMNEIAAVGNLYSPNKGLDFLVANVLANPRIDTIVVCGQDRLNGGEALIKLWKGEIEKGEDSTGKECWLIPGIQNGRISGDFTAEDLNYFRQTVHAVCDWRNLSFEEICERLTIARGIPDSKTNGDQARTPRLIKLTESGSSKTLPNFLTGHRIIGETVAEVWLKILDFILKFGIMSNTQYQSMQLEHLNLVSIITDEDPNHLLIPDWFPITPSEFEKYLPTVLEKLPVPPGVSYYYSDRMRVRWGDQIEKIIEKLKESPESRQAVVSLWDPTTDISVKEPPCFNHLWFRIKGGKLFLTVTIRSNDMHRGYPGNALAARMLQEYVRKEIDLDLGLGCLVINSQSAHIYDETWDAARALVEKHWKEVVKDDRTVVDPCGIFLISVEDSQIIVRHLMPSGEEVQAFHGKTALSLYLQIQDFISINEHALYLGTELQKAQTALELGIPYIQDKPLTFVGPKV